MSGQIRMIFTVALLSGFLCACGADKTKFPGIPMSIQLASDAFKDGQPIPTRYACDGGDISPALTWTNAPAGAKSFALIADDPDAPAGTWVHWVVYDLPAGTHSMPENVSKSQYIPGNAKQGINDFQRLGYGGPCPPAGKLHRYFFKLYALDTTLELKPGATKAALLKAMEGHVLAQGQLMGTYERK